MTQIPPDDILEGLYKLRIRESEKLKSVLELYNIEIHQKKAGFDDHRLKTVVKRCTEQSLRIKNFEARNGNYEKRRGSESGDKTAWTKKSGRLLTVESQRAVFWRWQCSFVMILMSVQKRHSRILLRVLSCGRAKEMRREPEVPEARDPVVECFDCPARITSKELAHSNLWKWQPPECLFYKSDKKDADLVKGALMRIARLKNSPAKGLRMVTKVQ